MRKLTFILIFTGILQTTSGQDLTGRFEFGSTLASINVSDLRYSKPTYEFVNGLFFRYTKKRLGLRAFASYSDKTNSYTFPTIEPPYFWGRTVNNKDWKVGIGAQFSILNRSDWLYTFFDLSYRNVFSTGYQFGFMNETFSSTSNGFDCFAGIGFKLKMTKYFYLSPEVGCYSSNQFVNRTTKSADTYNLTTGQLVTREDSYFLSDFNSVFKLHLTVKF